MFTKISTGRVRKIYRFIDAYRDEYVATLCRVLEVTRSGFYQWLKHPLSNRALEDAWIFRRMASTSKTRVTA